MPKASGAMPLRSGISAIDITRVGSATHCTASKPEFTPQYGAVRLEAKVFTSAPTPWVNGKPSNATSAPHKRTAACGTMYW